MLNAREIMVVDTNKRVAKNTVLNEEDRDFVERFEEVCDMLLDFYGFAVTGLFQNMVATLFNDRSTVYNGEFGLGLERISKELDTESFAFESLHMQVSLQLNSLFEGANKPNYIEVTTYLENNFEGGVIPLNTYKIFHYELCGYGKTEIIEVVKKINAIYIKELLLLREVDLNNFVDQGDFDRKLLKKMARTQLGDDYINAEISSEKDGTPFIAWHIKEDDTEVRLCIRMTNQASNHGTGDVYIDLEDYLDAIL